MARILVVDDSPTEVFQFKDMLEKIGHEVIIARNGRDGVEAATNEQPDMVLMDIVMPDMNGFQATRHLSRSAQTSHIPVVIISSKDQDTDRVWGARQGARAYITKPVDEAELINLINTLV